MKQTTAYRLQIDM